MGAMGVMGQFPPLTYFGVIVSGVPSIRSFDHDVDCCLKGGVSCLSQDVRWPKGWARGDKPF
eukprot:8242115-Heterocapsa_arctica.AAC.1